MAHDRRSDFGTTISSIMRMLMARGTSFHDAEDAAQETLIREWAASREAVIHSPHAWRRMVAKRFDGARRRKDARRNDLLRRRIESESAAGNAGPDVEVQRRDLVRAMDAAVARLPNRLVLVVELRRSGHNSAEIGELLGCPASTIRSWWDVAKKLLRNDLADLICE